MLPSLWLALATSAHAADLDTLVEAWSITNEEGSATEARFDDAGDLVVTGWIDDGAGSLAVVRAYDDTGGQTFSYDTDPGPLADAANRWNDFAIDEATGNLALCGQRGGSASDLDFLVEVIDPAGKPLWTVPYGGPATSPEQSCHGIAWGTSLFTAGSIWQSDAVMGQWILWRLDPATGLVQWPGTADFGAVPGAPDAAVDVAVFTDGTVAVAGQASDTKLGTHYPLVQRRDQATVLWESLLPDDVVLAAIVVEPVSSRAVVVGTQGSGASSEAWMASFNQASGTPQLPVWETTWSLGSPSGATAIALDGAGEGLVAGWVDDGSGPTWRVQRVELGSGKPLDALELPGASGWPRGVAESGDLLGVVGTNDDTTFVVRMFGVDGDGDGVADVVDGCPEDTAKTDPGVCGCEVPDVDSDGDGALNCEEECGSDPLKLDPGICGCDVSDDDSDGDGTADCDDDCVDDPDKDDPGVCGCGVADSDDDRDGLLVCQDQCPDTPPGVAVDAVGCELDDASPDTGDTGADSKPPDLSGGCGCQLAQQAPGSAIVGWLGLMALARRRRSMA